MAAVGWKNNRTGNWNTPGNWSNSLVPTSIDTVTIGFGSSTTTTFSVTEDAASASASTLTINGNSQGSANHPVTLSMVGNTLTVGTTGPQQRPVAHQRPGNTIGRRGNQWVGNNHCDRRRSRPYRCRLAE